MRTRVAAALLTAAATAGAVALVGRASGPVVPPGGTAQARQVAVVGPPALPRPRAQARPDIVLIMVDDMRDDDLRFMPHTRRLIRDQGVRFVNAFSPYPWCCPARASVLSGLYTHNHGVWTVHYDYGFHAFDDRFTLATMLHRAGYATILLGKYLNRYGQAPPHGRTSGNSLHYVPPGWDEWRASLDGGFLPGSPYQGNTYSYYDTTLSVDGRGFQPLEGRYQTRAYGEIARRVISSRAASPQPFFLYLAFSAPHVGHPYEPDDPPPTYDAHGTEHIWRTPVRPPDVKGRWDRVVTAAPGRSWRDPHFAGKPRYLRQRPALGRSEWSALRELTRQRAEALTVVDQQVRALLQTLARTGELDDTLVVFTSDNGYFLGEQHMRQGKIYPQEPSLRVPLLMRGPGIPAGGTRHDPFTSIDFLPTLASAAGTTPERRPDGISLWRVARHGDTGWRRGILTETGALGQPPRDTDMAGLPLALGNPQDIRFLIGVRTPRYLYVDVAHERDELYDLRRDPREYTNQIGNPRYARVRALLEAELVRLRDCRGATCSAPLPRPLQRR
ncbi:MAG TPA: sulfatase-like hydrolase/transferase [Marmoricola sp.]|nr:sulfatase-like hydrolase/transferase [Marmoricola sp.]